VLIFLFSALVLNAASSREDAYIYVGFLDADKNGINDLFCDADGDGVNDINGQIYRQDIKFSDKNKDGINDFFVDSDGDGVNDVYLLSKEIAVLDFDNNGVNDITGKKYGKGFYSGYLLGKCFEEKGLTVDKFIDENNDMMDDNVRTMIESREGDKFIDENGDGICDGREPKIERMKETQNKQRQENDNPNKKGPRE